MFPAIMTTVVLFFLKKRKEKKKKERNLENIPFKISIKV